MKRDGGARSLRRAGLWLSILVTGSTVCNAVELRRRVSNLVVLPPSDHAVRENHHFVTAAGVELDEATRRAASEYASEHGLDVLDLVPADLPTERALELARRFDPVEWRSDPFALGGGAYHALLASADALQRAQINDTDQLDPAAMARATLRLKEFRSLSTDLAVAPGLSAIVEQIETRRTTQAVLFPVSQWVRPGMDAAPYVALAAATLAHPAAGVFAAAAYSVQPRAIFDGTTPVVPSDLRQFPLARLVNGPRRWFASIRGDAPPSSRASDEVRRATYAADIAAGLDRFFEPRRDTCPWCGRDDLSVILKTPDRFQHKPGEFFVEQCGSCKHFFQNPRLSLEGLEFYYRDFYDGVGDDLCSLGFVNQKRLYEGRVALTSGIEPPKRWLDVGTGHAHFCAVAKKLLPDTTFDGLDMNESVEVAERRGWIERGYRGMFPELADSIAGRYDVVSMHHYLEHTREPFDELDAARTALTAGGHLLIEVPNPEAWPARVLGKYWLQWVQPQHQHMFPFANLEQALADRGFTTVAADHGRATTGADWSGAIFAMLPANVGIAAFAPAATKRTGRDQLTAGLRQCAFLLGAIPLLPLAGLANLVNDTYCRTTDRGGSAYRILVRKQPTDSTSTSKTLDRSASL